MLYILIPYMTIILQDCFIHPSLPGDHRNFHQSLLRILGALHVDRTVDLVHLWTGKSWAIPNSWMVSWRKSLQPMA